jgi:putative nucleotidyltransferase with HDIG domain
MDQQDIQHLRAEVIAKKNLPTIPVVLAKILQLSNNLDANGKDLIAVIEKDQALTGKMLRLANSAFFGQSRRVATIPRAVVLLGFSTVRNLALGVKVWDALGTGISRPRLEELWTHSVAVAAAAKMVSARLRVGDPDETFTAGLLHDVGRLVLAMRFRDDYWKAVGGPAEADGIEVMEREHFGVDHAEVGGWMLEAWALPPGIVEAVRLHHAASGRQSGPNVLALTDRLVALSDLAAGTLRPEGLSLLESAAERGVTGELWQQALAHLRDGGILSAFRLGG